MWRTLAVVVALGMHPAFAAEETVGKLPPDGAWIRYHVQVKKEDEPEVAFKSTWKFLGRQVVEGHSCRVIEMIEQYGKGPEEALQFLVPERALRESANPMAETVMAFQRSGTDNVEPFALDSVGFFGSSMLFLPATRRTAQLVREPQTIDYQAGRLTIPAGQRGDFLWKPKPAPDQDSRAWISEYTIWLDPKLPVGMARGQFQFRMEVDGVVNSRWTHHQTVEEFGIDAKSTFSK